ncbi:MAG TPA: SEC-C domain-containing protein [Thermoanaerobaculia bacterium]
MARRVDRFSQIVLNVFKRIFGSRLQKQETTHRSAPCPCGSGLKYKRCCLPKETARSHAKTDAAPRKPTGRNA